MRGADVRFVNEAVASLMRELALGVARSADDCRRAVRARLLPHGRTPTSSASSGAGARPLSCRSTSRTTSRSEQVQALQAADRPEPGSPTAGSTCRRTMPLTRFREDFPDLRRHDRTARSQSVSGLDRSPAQRESPDRRRPPWSGSPPTAPKTGRCRRALRPPLAESTWAPPSDSFAPSGSSIVAMLAVAAALTVANVVRLAAYARRDEIEIMQLVGRARSPTSAARSWPRVCCREALGAIVAIVAAVGRFS